MRRRRADNCLLRASAALDAEYPEAAEEALNEARELYPAHPQLEEVAARLLSTSTGYEPHIAESAPLRIALGLGWLLALLALLA